MKRHVRILLIIIIIFTIPLHTVLSAVFYPELLDIDKNDYMMDFFTALYSAYPIEKIETRFQSAWKNLETSSLSEPLKLFSQARLLMYIGKHVAVEEYCKDEKVAFDYLEQANGILNSLETQLYQEEILALSSEIYGSIFLIDRVKHLFSYGLQSSKLANEAYSLAPENIHVQILRGNQLLFSPGFAGGSSKKAEKIFLQLLENTEILGKVDLFSVYSSLGLALKKNKKFDLSLKMYQKALNLFPDNNYIKDLYNNVLQ